MTSSPGYDCGQQIHQPALGRNAVSLRNSWRPRLIRVCRVRRVRIMTSARRHGHNLIVPTTGLSPSVAESIGELETRHLVVLLLHGRRHWARKEWPTSVPPRLARLVGMEGSLPMCDYCTFSITRTAESCFPFFAWGCE